MVCRTSCAIASAFLGGMAWIMLNTDKETKHKYLKTMNAEQLVIKNAIVKNRAWIWLQGIVIGIIFGLLFVYMNKTGNGTGNANTSGCYFAAIVLGVNYLYYMLADKGTYMIQHLQEDQIPEWLAVKKMYQTNYHVGMLLGLAGCFFLGRGLSM